MEEFIPRFKKVCTFGGWNPTHFGHMDMIKKGSKFTEQIDVLIGQKKKNYRLPSEVRAKTLHTAIKNTGMHCEVFVLAKKYKMFKVRGDNYDALLIGSDLACLFNDMKDRGRVDVRFFYSFNNLIIIERPGRSMSDKIYGELMKEFEEVIIVKGETEESSTAIRAVYRYCGLDGLRGRVPGDILDITKRHLDVFHNEEN